VQGASFVGWGPAAARKLQNNPLPRDLCRKDDRVPALRESGAGIDERCNGSATATAQSRPVCCSVRGRWRKTGDGCGPRDAGLLKRFSRDPGVAKARVEFERAQRVEERFHKDFDALNFTSR
jgi:hypothetical protein